MKVLGDIERIEPIATGRGIRERKRLVKVYGQGRWRKMKGFATVELMRGRIVLVELHWYEAHGIGRREMKIKRIIDK